MISPTRLSVDSVVTDPATSTFSITLRYNAANSFIFTLPGYIPLPSSTIVRSAAIQRGGY